MKLNFDRSQPVAVTGATGYVAGHIIKELLNNGFKVHGSVRDPQNKEKLKYLNKMAKDLPGSIVFFQADLLQQGSFDKCFENCSRVFHTASPFKLEVSDPKKDLIDPALEGTRNVLESVNKWSSIERVILTSSCAAIYGDVVDIEKTPNGVFTEDHWNNTSSLDHNPYSFSKTLAEKEAWKIQKQQDRWDLVTINPSFVMGPGINPLGTSESFNVLRQIGDGTMKAGLPDWGIGIVDVRDVATAHFNAAFTAKAKGRYIVSAHDSSFIKMVKPLQDKFGNRYPIPKKALPKWLVWAVGPLMNKSMTRKSISRNVGYAWRGDNSKGKMDLGLSYRPLEETMTSFFQQMIDNKVIRAK